MARKARADFENLEFLVLDFQGMFSTFVGEGAYWGGDIDMGVRLHVDFIIFLSFSRFPSLSYPPPPAPEGVVAIDCSAIEGIESINKLCHHQNSSSGGGGGSSRAKRP